MGSCSHLHSLLQELDRSLKPAIVWLAMPQVHSSRNRSGSPKEDIRFVARDTSEALQSGFFPSPYVIACKRTCCIIRPFLYRVTADYRPSNGSKKSRRGVPSPAANSRFVPFQDSETTVLIHPYIIGVWSPIDD